MDDVYVKGAITAYKDSTSCAECLIWCVSDVIHTLAVSTTGDPIPRQPVNVGQSIWYMFNAIFRVADISIALIGRICISTVFTFYDPRNVKSPVSDCMDP